MTNFKDVADWMLQQAKAKGVLYQDDAVWSIRKKFGKGFTYNNASGNLAIHKGVLNEFRKISDDLVWERGQKCWRKRLKTDMSSRMQD